MVECTFKRQEFVRARFFELCVSGVCDGEFDGVSGLAIGVFKQF